MSTLILLFVVGYIFHLIYKVFDRLFVLLSDLRKKKEVD